MGGKAKYHVHDLPKEAQNRSSKRQELKEAGAAGRASRGGRDLLWWRGQMFALGLPGCGGHYGKGCPTCRNGRRKGLQGEAQRMGRYVEHKTRLGRASKAKFMGWSVFHKQ